MSTNCPTGYASVKMTSRIGLLLALLWLVPVWAQQAVPPLTGRVVDAADILSDGNEQALATMLAAHEDSTSNQVAVLTVSSLGGEAIEDFSLRVAEAWGLGQAGTDNGVLLLVAVDDREMRIEVGYGLEDVLTDAAAGRIIRDDIAPQFRNGNYNAGVQMGVQRILGTIDGSYVPDETLAQGGGPISVGGWILRLVLFSIGLLHLFQMMLMPGLKRPFWAMLAYVVGFSVFILIAGLTMEVGFGRMLTVVGQIGLALVLAALALTGVRRMAWAQQVISEVKAARKSKKHYTWGPFTLNSTRSSSGGSSFSSSSSGFSSSSSSSFSGGGGSFGGGGASGSW